MIAIVNYGSGNVSAIANIYKKLRVPHKIVDNASELSTAEKYVLPGVGHFNHTMSTMRDSGILDVLSENVIDEGKPLLGICVGMQLLAHWSDEGDVPGLGWIPGAVHEISAGNGLRLPHMGWNSISIEHDPLGLFRAVDPVKGFYFLHRYHFAPDAGHAMATTTYGMKMVCAVTNGKNVFGLQFHPEKSHRNGLIVFRNFAEA